MKLNNMLHIIAGTFIFFSVILGFTVSQYFFYFTGFVGLNLFQSGFTSWCPMISLLRWAGFKD